MAHRFFDHSRRAVDGTPLLTVASNAWKSGKSRGAMAEKVAERLEAYCPQECTQGDNPLGVDIEDAIDYMAYTPGAYA